MQKEHFIVSWGHNPWYSLIFPELRLDISGNVYVNMMAICA